MLDSSGSVGLVTVTDAVATIILRNYVILESLKLKIVNYHVLASKIASEMEDAGREANMEKMVVAIKRFSDSLHETKVGIYNLHINRYFKGGDQGVGEASYS